MVTALDVLNANGITLSEEEIAHYGVVGMKWGKRKSATGGSAKPKKPSVVNPKDIFGNPKIVREMERSGRGLSGKEKSQAQAKVVSKYAQKDPKKLASAAKRETAKQLKADRLAEFKRLKGVSRIVAYGGDKKAANRASTIQFVGAALKGAAAVGLTTAVVASTGGSALFPIGVAVLAAPKTAAIMNRSVSDIKNVNSAAEVFNPSALLTKK